MATLIGVARTLPETCTFGVPVFVDGLGRKVAQRIDEAGTVINFELMETPAEFRPVESRINVSPGDAALFAFEIAAETFLVGTGRELAEALKHEAPTAAALRDATRRAVQRFVDSMHPMSPASADGVLIRCVPPDASAESAGARFRRAVWSAAAAALILLSIVLFAMTQAGVEPPREAVATEVDGPKTERLSDGSIVSLSPGSKLLLEFTAERRIVRLTRGKALFTVAKDETRPFTVLTYLVDATAMGTQFTVIVGDGVRVEVHQGIVELSRAGPSKKESFITLRQGNRYVATGGEQMLIDPGA